MKIILSILLIAIQLANSVFLPSLKAGSAFAEIQQIDSSNFGKKLIDTIALQLKSNQPLEDVAYLLDNLLHNVVIQQNEQDDMHDQQEVECKKTIDEYTKRQDLARENIRDSAYNVKKIHVQLKQNEGAIEQKTEQLALLNERQTRLEHQQEEDQVNYNERKNQLDSILEALDTILPKIRSAVSGQEGEQIYAELARIGKKNPIAALVAIASAFNEDEKVEMLDKLDQLKENMVNSYQDNEQLHQDTVLRYVNQKGELEMLIDDITNDLEALKQTKTENEAKLQFEMQRRDQSTEELDDAQHGLDMKSRQCAEWKALFEQETEARFHRSFVTQFISNRKKELDIIRRIIEIVSTKMDIMNEYLQSR